MDPLLSGSDFGQLRAFVAVGEGLSFSRAAERLGQTPSAVSQLVRALEARIGVRLLNRTTRSVALTDAGAQLFGQVQPAVAVLGGAIDEVQRVGQRPSGTVRVHASARAATHWVEPILGRFAEAFPQVVLDITVDDAAIDMVGAGFDVAIRIGEVIDRDLVAVRLGRDMRQLAVASPAYLHGRSAPTHPRDLLEHRCIRWRWPGHVLPYAWEFFENGRWFEVQVSGPLIVNDKQLAVEAALQGVGIAFAAEDQVRDAIGEGRLVALLDAWSAPFPGHFLCYPAQRQMAPALRAFIDTVRDAAADIDGP